MADGAQKKGVLERFLGLFADVHRGEGPTALLLMVNIFLLLTTYSILKPVREGLILAIEGGAELKSYMAAGQSVLLVLVVVPAYSALASRMPRRRLVNTVTTIFILCLVLFYLLAQIDVPLGIVFFLWIGIFNVMIVAQFWSFANDVYTEKQGKRLFAIVGFGASLGGVLGSGIALSLIEPLGLFQLMLVASAFLALSLVLTNVIDKRERARPKLVDGSPEKVEKHKQGVDEPVGSGGAMRAFQLVVRSRYLLLIAMLILFLNWVNTTGEYILGRIVRDSAVAGGGNVGESISIFFAGFQLVVNIVSLLIQLFLVSRILKYFGVRVAMLMLPLIALGGYLLVVLYPVLGVVRWAKTAENATDYSLQNTLRAVLFLPTTREQKYMAKQAIDTIFVRLGDVLSALLVFVGTTYLSFSTQSFAMVNLVFVSVWIVLAFIIGREYVRLVRQQEAENEVREAA